MPHRTLLRGLRPALLLVLGVLPWMHPAPVAAAPLVITLEGIDTVTDVRAGDTDADGVADLLVLSGRVLRVYGLSGTGEARALAPAPRHRWTVPDDVSFVAPPAVAAKRTAPGAEHVAWVGAAGADFTGADAPWGEALAARARAAGLGWRDSDRAAFVDLDRGARGWVLPTPRGWVHEAGIELAIPRARRVKAPGPFLEDTCVVEAGLPRVFVGRVASADRGSALWAIADRKLIAQAAGGRVAYDIAFLGLGEGTDFDQTLVDLDGDERPEILHRIHTNRQTHYGFFRTRVATKPTGPSHGAPNCRISLQGFQLEPEFVDLDGDGRLDLVITSMQVNAPNMISALSKGKVVAETRAFLNRSRRNEPYFVATPDATIASEIGVKVRFNYAGNIEVVRAIMIVTGGDFDGDGRKDLAIRTTPTTVRIHPGRAGGVWASAEDAVRTVTIPPMGASTNVEGHAMDLDGDGRDELILVYKAPEGGQDIVRIVHP